MRLQFYNYNNDSMVLLHSGSDNKQRLVKYDKQMQTHGFPYTINDFRSMADHSAI